MNSVLIQKIKKNMEKVINNMDIYNTLYIRIVKVYMLQTFNFTNKESSSLNIFCFQKAWFYALFLKLIRIYV